MMDSRIWDQMYKMTMNLAFYIEFIFVTKKLVLLYYCNGGQTCQNINKNKVFIEGKHEMKTNLSLWVFVG